MLLVSYYFHNTKRHNPKQYQPLSVLCNIQTTVCGMSWIIMLIYFLNRKQRQGGDKTERWEVKKVRWCQVDPLRVRQREYEHLGLILFLERLHYNNILIMGDCFGREYSNLSLPKGHVGCAVIFLFLPSHYITLHFLFLYRHYIALHFLSSQSVSQSISKYTSK